MFTEEEYIQWFATNKPDQKKARKIMAFKGVDTKFAGYWFLEKIVFHNIKRETRDSNIYFPIFKNVITSSFNRKEIKWVDVYAYVMSRRPSCSCLKTYIDKITGIILSGSVLCGAGIEAEHGICYGNVVNKRIMKRGTYTECVAGGGIKHDDPCMCEYCIFRLTDFADDCTIKLGREIFNKQFHKYFLFMHQIKIDIVSDVVINIGTILVQC